MDLLNWPNHSGELGGQNEKKTDTYSMLDHSIVFSNVLDNLNKLA
jgi:hypothetical protein